MTISHIFSKNNNMNKVSIYAIVIAFLLMGVVWFIFIKGNSKDKVTPNGEVIIENQINKEDDEPFSERIFKMGFLILVVGGLLVLVYNVMKLMYSAGVLWSENVRIVVTIVLSLAVGMGWMCVVYIVMDNLDVINRKIAKIKQKIKTIFS